MSLLAPSSIPVSGAGVRVGLVAARFNQELVDALLAQTVAHLRAAGVAPDDIAIWRVPGSHELPVAAQRLLVTHQADVVIALGLLIRGDTIHYQLVAEAAGAGLLRVSLDARKPVIAGVIVAETPAQAEARCRGPIDRGGEFARAALEMAALFRTHPLPS